MAAICHIRLSKIKNLNFFSRWGERFITVPNLIKIGQKVAEIWWFHVFRMAAVRHLGFSKIRNFNGRSAVRGQCASLYQISSKSVQRLQWYGDLTVFSKWRPSAIFDLWNSNFLMVCAVKGHILHQRTWSRCKWIWTTSLLSLHSASRIDINKTL